MLLSVLFLVLLVGVQSTPIKDGEIVTDIRAHPYVVRLFILGRVWRDGRKVVDRNVCTGILVKEDYVVTAAHCIDDSVEQPLITVKAGTVDLLNEETLQTATVKYYKKHSNFNRKTSPGRRKPHGENDIAVLWLNDKLKIRRGVRLANLESRLTDLTNAVGLAVGWGSTSKELVPRTLQRIKMVVKPKTTCEGIIIHRLSNQFCATGKSYPDSGDSGGPFVVNKIVVGITSWFDLEDGVVPVFLRVYPYFDWIEKNYKKGPPNSATNKPSKSAKPIKPGGNNRQTVTRETNKSAKGNESTISAKLKSLVNPSNSKKSSNSNIQKPSNKFNKKQKQQ